MKEYRYEIEGKTYRVRIRELYGEQAVVEVNNKTYQVGIKMAEVPIKTTAALAPSAITPAGPASRTSSAAAPDGAIKAPMPGVILKVKVEEGDMVNAGQAVMVIEAMKMENDIKAPRSGQVKKVLVGAGDSVNTGDPLIIVGD